MNFEQEVIYRGVSFRVSASPQQVEIWQLHTGAFSINVAGGNLHLAPSVIVWMSDAGVT